MSVKVTVTSRRNKNIPFPYFASCPALWFLRINNPNEEEAFIKMCGVVGGGRWVEGSRGGKFGQL